MTVRRARVSSSSSLLQTSKLLIKMTGAGLHGNMHTSSTVCGLVRMWVSCCRRLSEFPPEPDPSLRSLSLKPSDTNRTTRLIA